MNNNTKKTITVIAIGVGIGLGVAGLSNPPEAEECITVTVLAPSDGGQVLETVDICGNPDGGLETGEEFTIIHPRVFDPARPEREKHRARNGKAIGLHRNQASGCACSTGLKCERLIYNLDGSTSWAIASFGNVMQENEWRGTGCLPIPSCYDVKELPLGSNLVPGCIPDAGTSE